MKILLVNPHVDAGHKVVTSLQAIGAGVLLAQNAEEGWQMLQLHGKSIDLAVIHREGAHTDSGLKLAEKIKAEPTQADLPYIVTSTQWGDTEFVAHQATPMGANAYLRWPFAETQLIELISSLFGEAISSGTKSAMTTVLGTMTGTAGPPSFQTSQPQPKKDGPIDAPTDIILEEAGNLFNAPPPMPTFPGEAPIQISLEAPESFAATMTGVKASPAPAPLDPTAPIRSGTGSVPVLVMPDTGIAMPLPQEPGRTSISLASLDLTKLGKDSQTFTSAMSDSPPPLSDEPSLHLGNLSESSPQGPTINLDGPPVYDLPPSRPSLASLASPTSLESDESEPAPVSAPEDSEADERELASEMPYLFSKGRPAAGAQEANPALVFAQPVGDAVVPGGAVHSPDVETLKKYLLLREQDVAVLSTQLKATQDQVHALENQLKAERGQNTELQRTLDDQKRKIDEFEKEKSVEIGGLQAEIDDQKFNVKAKGDKARVLEGQVREAAQEIERLKERVRSDIRKIRVREKELENRLEIVKKDSEALIAARENKIIELKRKIDILEFNMDLLQDQYTREKEVSAKLRERLAKAAQVVRVAGGLLDANALAAGVSGGEGAGAVKSDEEKAS